MVEFTDGKPIQDPSIIERFEEEHGITFPADYKAVVLQNDGAYPTSSFVPVNDPNHGLQYYSCAQLLNYEDTGNIFTLNPHNDDYLEPGVIAFGISGSGVLFCFDYRTDPDHPSIVVVTGELDVTDGTNVPPLPVAPDFTTLINSFLPTSYILEMLEAKKAKRNG